MRSRRATLPRRPFPKWKSAPTTTSRAWRQPSSTSVTKSSAAKQNNPFYINLWPDDVHSPFFPPKELRGVSLNVTFWVGADGRVERYRVEPQIKDREYAKKFDEVMRAFRFTPARAPNGSRVAGTTSISFTLPGKSSS